MYRRFAVAFVLVLAGCSGFGGGPTQTAGPTEADGGAGSDGGGFDVPGVGGGTVNESALLEAHFRTLNDSAYRLHYRTRSNGTVDSNSTTIRNDTRVLHRSLGSLPSVTYGPTDRTWTLEHERWGDERYVFTYDASGVLSTAGSIEFGASVYISAGQFERAGTTTYRGERVARLEAADAKSTGLAAGYEQYEATLLVDERGLIRRATGTVEAGDGPPTAFEITAETGIERVPRPSWVPEVPRGRAALAANDTALRVRLTGGPTVPANTTVEFSARLRTYTVETDRPTEPGDELYLSLRPGEYEPTATLTRTPPDPATRLSVGDNTTTATIRLASPPALDAPVVAFFRAGRGLFETRDG